MEFVFDDRVLQRVERKSDNPTAGFQSTVREFHGEVQFIYFVIDKDSQSLESFGGHVAWSLQFVQFGRETEDAFDQLSQFSSRFQAFEQITGFNDGPSDFLGLSFFSIHLQSTRFKLSKFENTIANNNYK